MKKLLIFLISIFSIIFLANCTQPLELTENDYDSIIESIKKDSFYNHNSEEFKNDCMTFIINEKDFLITYLNPIYQENPEMMHHRAPSELKKRLGKDYATIMNDYAKKYSHYGKDTYNEKHVKNWIKFYFDALKKTMREKESSN